MVTFKASIESETAVDGSELQWTSDKDGNLGNGLEIETSRLSCGTHKIDIIGYGQNVSFAIRVFNDLWELYQASPAQGEIDRILNDFTFSWVDGSADDERWANYDSWSFDQESINPAKIVAIAKLDVLRHQRFSEPLPFQNVIGEETVYEHIRRYVTTIELRLDANPNYAGNGRVSVNRGFSMWYGMLSGTKTAVTSLGLIQYVHSLYLLVHEARHCEPGEPGHTTLPNGVQGDATLENGSGHAQAALYCMWVYQYGLYEALATKQSAQEIAVLLLTTRFSSKPTHSNPNVQAILDQLLP